MVGFWCKGPLIKSEEGVEEGGYIEYFQKYD
jgi:hypothetical protein